MAKKTGAVAKAKAGVSSSLKAVKDAVLQPEVDHSMDDPQKAAQDAEAVMKNARNSRQVDPGDYELAKLALEMRKAEEREKRVRIETSNPELRKFDLELSPEEEKAVSQVLAKLRGEHKAKAAGGAKEKFTVEVDTEVNYVGNRYIVKKGSYSSDELFADAPQNLSFDRDALVAHFRGMSGVKREMSQGKPAKK